MRNVLVSKKEKTISSLKNKGVSEKWINHLKTRKVTFINNELYEKKSNSINSESEELIDIPVNKITSTHRMGANLKSWWHNIFYCDDSSFNVNRWVNVEELFNENELYQFREKLYSMLPPLESVYYYPELDVYQVLEGHHRTTWAILTQTPYLRVKLKDFHIYELSSAKCKKRREYLKLRLFIKREIHSHKNKLYSLIHHMNFSYKESNIKYKEESIFIIENKSLDDIFQITDIEGWVLYLEDIELAIEYLTKLFQENKKYNYLPSTIKIKWLKYRYFLRQSYEVKKLLELYELGWKPKSIKTNID